MLVGGQGVETFLDECEDLLAQVEEVVLELEEGPEGGEAINRAFRIFHSIKGSAALVGFTEIASFTHHVESLLDQVRAGSLALSRDVTDIVLASKDHIEALVLAARGGPPVAAACELDLLERLRETGGAFGPAAVPLKAQRRTFTIRLRPRVWIESSVLAALFGELTAMGDCVVTLDDAAVPALDTLDPATCHLAWTITLISDASGDQVRDRFIFVEPDIDLSIVEDVYYGDEGTPIELFDDAPGSASAAPVPASLPVLASLPALASVPPAAAVPAVELPAAPAPCAPERTRAAVKAKAESMVRISAEKLDRLVDLVGELVITQSRLAVVSARLKSPDLDSPVEEIQRLVVELREGVLGVRMMAIGTTFSRFKRLVHDLSGQLGKEIDLVTEGAETELDKSVLDQLVDPLMHLVRNSIDHGIEPADVRAARGKPARGTIRLSAVHAGQHVVITIQDDGKGLDADAIRQKAISRKLLEPGQSMAPADLFKLIFLPGFSTAAQLSDVSGRGVGMDVVKRQIEALRGTVTIASEPGKGTTMSLRLPLTLAIIDGLLVQIANDCYIVPLAAVSETVELPPGDRERANGRRAVVIRGEIVPYISLRDAFAIPGALPANEQVVILQDGDDRVGMVVDHVLGNHQTVIQPLGRFYAGVEVVSGATIMGDGRAALILDIAGIIRLSAKDRNAA